MGSVRKYKRYTGQKDATKGRERRSLFDKPMSSKELTQRMHQFFENILRGKIESRVGPIYGKLASTIILSGIERGIFTSDILAKFSELPPKTQRNLIDEAGREKDKSFALKQLIVAQT